MILTTRFVLKKQMGNTYSYVLRCFLPGTICNSLLAQQIIKHATAARRIYRRLRNSNDALERGSPCSWLLLLVLSAGYDRGRSPKSDIMAIHCLCQNAQDNFVSAQMDLGY